jgi:hypothetical protein
MWDQHDLGRDYNPTTDVLAWCDELDVKRNDWDGDDRPMYAEIDYEVWVRDPETAKASMLKRIWQLIGERDKARR